MRAGPFCCLVLFGLLAGPVAADLVVIVHPDNPIGQLERHQLIDIYMGRTLNFPDGGLALPIDQQPQAPARAEFYRRLVDKTPAQVNAYWARLLFTGQATPPRVLPSVAAILQAVRENRAAIAYLELGPSDEQYLDHPVKVVFRLD